MEKYISKDAAIAEIERLKKDEGWCQVGKDTADVYYARGFRFACERIKDALNTLETKEEDLDFQRFAKEMDAIFALPSSETKNTEENPLNWEYSIAKHFFELGMQVSNNAQKEPVSEDLEEAAVEAFKQIVDADKNNFLEIFKAGAQWQKEQEIKYKHRTFLQGEKSVASYILKMIDNGWHINAIYTVCGDKLKED